MPLKRKLAIAVLVLVPPAAGLALATAFNWLRFEWSLGGVLLVLGAYAGWVAILGGLAEFTGFFRKEAVPAPGPGPLRPPPSEPEPSAFSTHVQDQSQVVNVAHAETVIVGVEDAVGTGQAVPLPPATSLPNPPEPFVNRAAERAALAEKLRRGGAHLLCGLGGVGKSALALRVAHDLAGEGAFPDGVFWLPLESGPTPEMAAVWLATALGVTGGADPLGALAGLLRARYPLIVLDNAEAAVDAAEELLKHRGRAAVLVTSRDVRVGATAIPGAVDDLAPLEADDAADLLRAWLGKVPIADAQAAEVCDLVGGLPLALVLAAAFMARELRGSADPAAEYLDLLRATPLAALEMGDRRDTSVRVTFDLSWRRLDDDASRALAVLALAPGDSVGTAGVAAGLDADEAAARAALRDLTRLSLAEREGDRIRTHPLVRHYAREQTDDVTAADLRACLRRYYLAYAREHQVGADNPYCGPLDLERDNVLGTMNWAWEGQDWPAVVTFAGATKYYLQLRGYPHLARERAGWWLAAARRLDDRPEEASAILSLGDVHLRLDEYGLARERYEEALPLYREIGARLGEANAVTRLGDVHLSLDEGRHDDAEALYRQALGINQAIGNRHGLAHTMAMLGRLAAARGQKDDARRLLEEAAQAFEAMGAKGATGTVRGWLEGL
jgi:tetratricopeptide (TPR) repeat protein